MSYRIGQVVRGKVWAGEDYGFQTPATFQKLKQQGAFKLGAKQLNRIGSALTKFYEKNAPKVVKDAVSAYGQRLSESQQQQAQLEQSIISSGGAASLVFKAKQQASQRRGQDIAALSDKTNVDPRILEAGLTVAETVAEGKVGIDSLRTGVRSAAQNRIKRRLLSRKPVAQGTELFHGTGRAAAENIINEGFRPSKSGELYKGGVYGSGVYSAPDDRYASMYAAENPNPVLLAGKVPGGHRILDITAEGLDPYELRKKLGVPSLKKWAEDNGYDGIRFRPGGDGADEVLTFNSKLADQMFSTGIHTRGEPFPGGGTVIKERPKPTGKGGVPTRQSTGRGRTSRVAERLRARSVGAKGNPNTNRIEHPDEAVRAVLEANKKRPPQLRAEPTAKTAGRKASDVGATVEKTKAGNYIVRGNNTDVTFKASGIESDADVRHRAENYARGLDLVQSKTPSIPERLRLTPKEKAVVQNGSIRIKRRRIDTQTRPNTNQFIESPLSRQTVDDMEVVAGSRIKSKLQRKRSTEAARAAKRAEAKSDVPNKPADAPVGGTATKPTGTGVNLGADKPVVSDKRIRRKLAQKEWTAARDKARSEGKDIRPLTLDERLSSAIRPLALDSKTGKAVKELDKGYRTVTKPKYPSKAEAPTDFESSEVKRRDTAKARATDEFRRKIQKRMEKYLVPVDEYGAEFRFKDGITDAEIKEYERLAEQLSSMRSKATSIKDRLELRKQARTNKVYYDDKQVGLRTTERPSDAKHPNDIPELKTKPKRKVRREMTSENAEAQERRTAKDIEANPLRRVGKEGGAKVKTLPGRDPFTGPKGERIKTVLDEIWNEKLRDFRGNTTELSKWWKKNDDLINSRLDERLESPQAAIKWYDRFKRKDIETGTRTPSDEIPDRAPSRIRERLKKGSEPTDAEKRLRKKLENDGDLIPDFSKQGNSKKIAELNKDFVQALELSGELTLDDDGQLVRRRIRRRAGAEGRQNLKGARFDEDSFRFSDVDKTGGKPGREGGRNLNRDIRNRLRTLDYEEFFEEFYPRSNYPADMSAAEVHKRRNNDFARDFPETARILGGRLKTDNPAGRESVRNQFREARERAGTDGLPKNTEDLRRSDNRNRTENLELNKAGRLVKPAVAIKNGKPVRKQPQPNRGLIERARSRQRTSNRTVPISPTVLDTGSGLNQPKRRSRIQSKLDSIRSRIKNPEQQVQKLQEAKAKTEVKLDRLRRQLQKARSRRR